MSRYVTGFAGRPPQGVNGGFDQSDAAKLCSLNGLVQYWGSQNEGISFAVTSDGTSGSQWITRLESSGRRVSPCAQWVLLSPQFRPTASVTSRLVVFPGTLFEDNGRLTSGVRRAAQRHSLGSPSLEVACLMRVMFADEQIEALGLTWLVVMHLPVQDLDGDLCLLGVGRGGSGGWLDTRYGRPDGRWVDQTGFVFVTESM